MDNSLFDHINEFHCENFFLVDEMRNYDAQSDVSAIDNLGLKKFLKEHCELLLNDRNISPAIKQNITKHGLYFSDINFRMGLLWRISTECVIRSFVPKMPFLWLTVLNGPVLFISKYEEDLFFLKLIESEL